MPSYPKVCTFMLHFWKIHFIEKQKSGTPLATHQLHFQKSIIPSKNIRFCFNIIRLSAYPVHFLPQYTLLDQSNLRYNIMKTSCLNNNKINNNRYNVWCTFGIRTFHIKLTSSCPFHVLHLVTSSTTHINDTRRTSGVTCDKITVI